MGAQGTTTVDFGAFPGKSDASVAVPETGVSDHPTSLAEAWLVPVDTADHSADEHLAETIAVRAGPCVAGVGFTVYAWNTSEIHEPLEPMRGQTSTIAGSATDIAVAQMPRRGGRGTRIYGLWTVAWCWN